MTRILVLGATGYTGGLAVDAMIRRGLRPVLVGRRASSLKPVAEKYGDLETRIADATDPTSIEELLRPGDVLVTTVGPFERIGFAAAAAAAAKGAHYVDSTGEVGFVRNLHRRLHDRASETGSTMLPAFGYDYVPGMLAGSLALRDSPHSERLEIGYFATGSVRHGLSHGTRTTMAEGLIKPTIAYRDGRLVDVRTAKNLRSFSVNSAAKTGFLVSGTEVLFLPATHPSLRTVEIYNGWFPSFSRFISAASLPVTLLAKAPLGAKVINKIGEATAGPVGGPDEEERSRTRSYAVARAFDAKGKASSEVHVEGPSIYSLTGELLALSAELLVQAQTRVPGVVGPIEAFGLDTVIEKAAEIGLARVNE